jgi:hypothetical protein
MGLKETNLKKKIPKKHEYLRFCSRRIAVSFKLA